MSELTETQVRRSETELMVGRVTGLSQSGNLNPDTRIGVCLALKVLHERRAQLELRRDTEATS